MAELPKRCSVTLADHDGPVGWREVPLPSSANVKVKIPLCAAHGGVQPSSEDDETVVPIGRCDTYDPHDAEYGGWYPNELVALVEAVIGLHAAVWPHGEVDGDGAPASILLEHAEHTRQQVETLRALAVEVSKMPRSSVLTQKALELERVLADHNVFTWADIEDTPDPFKL